MKKLLLLLLIAPMIGLGQDNFSNNISKVIILGTFELTDNMWNVPDDYPGLVPEGKIWKVKSINENPYHSFTQPNFYWFMNKFGDYFFELSTNTILPAGAKIVTYPANNSYNGYVMVEEYSLNNQNLAYNKSNPTTPTLYPNPTSSLLALNSDKEYDIEVYDMVGNKIMALTGNTIDMSHLSSATYIVKALDKVENEEVSYKVVKN